MKLNESFTVNQLATITDKALDNAYHYGISTPGNNFGWLANIESVKAAKKLIDSGERDIETISYAIHDGWNIIAKADSNGELTLDKPTPEDKKQKRLALSKKSYDELSEEDKEKDRVIARVLLKSLVL